MHDLKMIKFLVALILLPIGLAFFGGDKFRYPCQDPANWDKDICKPPICDVTRTCPEHVFKGQRDPRLGPPKDGINGPIPLPSASPAQGVNCGK
jgi:hypothetical protein